MKRTRVIDEDDHINAVRAAARAAMDTAHREFARQARVVDVTGLQVAAGELEDVSTFQLVEFLKDVRAELQRRGVEA
jgi:hypothetical protein